MLRGDVVNPHSDLLTLAETHPPGTYADADGVLWHAVPVRVVGPVFSKYPPHRQVFPTGWWSRYTLGYRVQQEA